MAKRGLCILLALAAVFSLSAPALAEVEPVEEPEEVLETEEPAAEPAPAAEYGDFGNGVFYHLMDDGVLTVSGSGAIPEDAFHYRDDVKTVVIEKGVTSIVDYAFLGCTSLTSVTIPDSVTDIGEWAFYDCSGLQEIQVTTGNSNYSSVGGVLFNAAGTEIVCFPKGFSGVYTIPDGVASIGAGAFFGCASLTGVTLPNTLTSIGESAFFYCESVTSVTIPNSVTSIGDYAFDSCYSLASVTIPGSVTAMGDYTFSSCTSLTDVTLQNGVTSIGDWAFEYCCSLTNLTIPNSVTSIGIGAFYNCSLTDITIPDSVTSIGIQAFLNSGLTSVTIPASVTNIGGQAFFGMLLTSVTVLNPNCTIGDEWGNGTSLGVPGQTVIHSYAGSTAEAYAELYGYKFEALSPVVTPKPQLAAPTVTISKVSTGIKVSWNAVTGSPRYMVYYKENNGSWVKIGTTTSTTYTRAAKYLKSGATYQFTVRCCANDKKTLLGPYKASNSITYKK